LQIIIKKDTMNNNIYNNLYYLWSIKTIKFKK
jgi:hypothetical protein